MVDKDGEKITEEERKASIAASDKKLDEAAREFESKQKEPKERTWRDSLPEISAILEACLEEAHGVLCKFADGDWTRVPSIEDTVKLADSLFAAVVTAEAGRRQAELQKQMGQKVTIPLLAQPGPEGVRFIKPPGT